MSELQEHQFCECDEYIREYRGPLSNEMRPYYLKSEADKVISNQKYKRCLAMAKWCRTSARCDEGLGAFKYRDWYWKWYKRWLKIAEKFKEEN